MSTQTSQKAAEPSVGFWILIIGNAVFALPVPFTAILILQTSAVANWNELSRNLAPWIVLTSILFYVALVAVSLGFLWMRKAMVALLAILGIVMACSRVPYAGPRLTSIESFADIPGPIWWQTFIVVSWIFLIALNVWYFFRPVRPRE